ncbi:MAG: DUF58 domain-containing protein [Cytophagales bacterium]|nr:DUF58 domain-containing protein [Cytophagales bacterium]
MKITLKDIAQFNHLDMLAQQLVDGFITGLHKSPYHGFSVEFAEHKLYNFGESTKHIDWKVFARTDRLYTKQYEEETNLRCHLIIDQSPSMYYPTNEKDKIKFAVLSAASIAHLLIKQRDAVGVTLFSDQINYQSAQKSTSSHLHNLLIKLGDVLEEQPLGQTNITKVIHEMAGKIPKRSLVILFTDMFQNGGTDELFTALQHLKHNLHEVLLFHISDVSTELEFDFPDRPSRFVDMETNEIVKVNPNTIRESYQKQMSKFYKEIKIRCGMLKVDFIEVNTAEPFDKVLGAYMLKRKRMQ